MKKLSKGLFLIFLMLAIAGAVYIIRREDSLDIREKAAGFDATVIVHSGSVGHDIKYGAHLNVHSDSSQFTVISDKNSDKHKSFVENFKKLGFSYHRIGFNVAEYDWTTEKNRDAIYDVLDFSDEVDSDPIFLMSVAGIIDPAREHKYMNPVGDEVTVRFPIGDLDDPAVYGIKDFVKEFTLDRKNAGKKYIKYYELGNEEWGWWDETEQRFLTPQEYIAAADQVSAAIEEVIQNDATLKSEVNVLGVSSRVLAEGYGGAAVPYGDGDFVIWGAKEYETSQNFYDYVTYHGYWHDRWAADMPEGESLFALDFHTAVDFVMYQDFFPAVIKFQRPAVTEWNLYCWTNPNAGRRHRNAQKFEHLFYVLGNQLKQFEYDVPFSIYHNYVPPTYTLSEQTNTERGGCNLLHLIEQNGSEYGISAPGVAFEILKDHFGESYVKTEISSPKISLDQYSGVSGEYDSIIGGSSVKDKKIYTVLINRDWDEDLTTKISLEGYSGDVNYSMYLLDAPALNSSLDDISFVPTVQNKITANGFDVVIPSMSSVVLEITKKECIPTCSGKLCGENNGCGGKCTNCPEGKYCDTGDWLCKETSPSRGCSIADINGKSDSSDGEVNAYDLSMVLSNWKCTTGPNCGKADIWGKDDKKDGEVGPFDLSRVLSCWKK